MDLKTNVNKYTASSWRKLKADPQMGRSVPHLLTDDEPARPESVYMHSACRSAAHEAVGPNRCRTHVPLPKYRECRKIAIFRASRLSR